MTKLTKIMFMISVVFASLNMQILAKAGTSGKQVWPNLDSIKFVSGRVAIQKDIDEGRAAFLLQHQGKPVSQPLKIQIPQYALHIQAGIKTRVVIIQAEEIRANHLKVLGAVDIKSKKHLAATFAEFTLLGTKIPQ